jgi:hypothetical protein
VDAPLSAGAMIAEAQAPVRSIVRTGVRGKRG